MLLQSAFAQTEDKKWGFGGGFGAYGTLENGQIGIMPELYLSRYLSPRFDLMLKGDMGVFRTKLKNNLDLVNPFLNLRFKLADETKNFRPYLFAGPGYLADNGVSAFNFDLGLGAKYYTKPNFALYLEAGYIRGIESTTYLGETGRENIWKVTAGGEIDFGKAKDADMDGVSDNKDKCPNTPAGVAVDKNGCPIDSDGDGVADYVDDCPTVAGLTSLKGCPDKDKDGVADKDDACPDVAGLVNLKGCPDTDGDGVTDKDDKCPATKKGDKVDASGCPLVVDTDNDGVIDSEDKCPTVAGTKENNGCPIDDAAKEAISTEMTIEPVYFDYDNSTIRKTENIKIEKLVNLLNSNSNYNVGLTGYTDSKGNEEYNLKLSERRINSVVKAITSSGIKAARISNKKPFGEAQPDATNDTEEGRALNRRIEFEIVKSK